MSDTLNAEQQDAPVDDAVIQQVEAETEDTGAETPPVESDDVKALAAEMGWKEGGEKSAKDFIKHTTEVQRLQREDLKELRAQMKAMKGATDRIVDAEVKRAQDAITKRYEAAIKAGDAVGAAKAVREYDATQYQPDQPAEHPKVAELKSASWFQNDPVARAAAIGAVDRAMAQGVTDVGEQMRIAQEEVAKRFPEHFPDAKPQQGRTPLVNAGQRNTPPAAKKYPKEVLAEAKNYAARGRGTEAHYLKLYDAERQAEEG